MNLKTKIFSASIAFVIAGGGATFATIAFTDYLTPAKGAEDAKYSETQTAKYKDGSTFEYVVKKPLHSTEDVQLAYKGKGQPPDDLGEYINVSQSLYNAITTQNDVRSLLNYLHLRFNTAGLGNGLESLKMTGVDGVNAWEGLQGKRWMDSQLYLRLAEVVDSKKVAEDFKNVAALVDIANTKKDALAVDYIHRILHDLDKWVYENASPGEEVSHFKATNSEKGEQVAEIETYITERPKLPAVNIEIEPIPSDPWTAFLAKIKTTEDVKKNMEPAYGRLNGAIRFGNAKKWTALDWEEQMKLNYFQPSMYERFAAVIDDENMKQDFQNLAKLIAYVRETRNLDAFGYAYEIAQDVNIYVMPTGAEDLSKTSKFGASFALPDHDEAERIDEWIKGHIFSNI